MVIKWSNYTYLTHILKRVIIILVTKLNMSVKSQDVEGYQDPAASICPFSTGRFSRKKVSLEDLQ